MSKPYTKRSNTRRRVRHCWACDKRFTITRGNRNYCAECVIARRIAKLNGRKP